MYIYLRTDRTSHQLLHPQILYSQATCFIECINQTENIFTGITLQAANVLPRNENRFNTKHICDLCLDRQFCM